MKNITEKKNLDVGKNQNLDYYNGFKESLELFPFIIIIGKYDHVLGPRAIYFSLKIKEEQPFIRNLLRDVLNTKSKFVIIDFDFFYAQIYKIEVEDKIRIGINKTFSYSS